jgi:DNA-directed RNA polymerase specialized sigma24 family protein
MERDDRERLLWQLAGKDNWKALEEVDSWLTMFDFLPPQMRLTVDLKMQGYSNPEIAEAMKVSLRMVQYQLKTAKERFMNSLL